MSNVSEFLLEWSIGIGHLKAASSTEELVRILPRAKQQKGDSVTAQSQGTTPHLARLLQKIDSNTTLVRH
jgi:hypothetical protein